METLVRAYPKAKVNRGSHSKTLDVNSHYEPPLTSYQAIVMSCPRCGATMKTGDAV
jgi:hypothetical protein